MSGWMNQPYTGGYGHQQQPQYPMQVPQPTGYLPQQRTGFVPQPQFQQPQPTGFMRPPVPMQPQATGFMGAPMQQRPMATGYAGGGGTGAGGPQPAPLVPQATGFNSSGLGAGVQNQFLQTFLPAATSHPSAYMQPGQMQFAAQQQLQAQRTGVAPAPSLQQQFQQSNQQQMGQANVPIPWKLTPEEKKRYDQIFRAWDQQGSGFLPGSMAKEVFGQAGLQQDDLMAIWNLADVNDRGKLNIDEFHVAMGLIYRRLNGNPIPSTLPAEMAPPSARDLEDSANFLTSLLKNDTNRRATNQNDVDGPQSRAKLRSLHESGPAGSSRKDATVFRNDDDATPVYKSSSRHLNRDDVRSRGNDSPSSELDEAKRRLREAQREAERSRAEDDDEEDLKEELRRLTRKIQRVQDDLDDNRRSGRRTAAKDEERRMLERELLRLEHEDLPRLEKRLEEKEREKRLDRKKHAIERDERNGPSSRRYEDRYDRDRYSSSSRYDDDDRGYSSRHGGDEESERGYTRGTYDREDRSRYAPSPPRRQSPPRSRTPPPPPPPAPSAAKIDAPPPPPPTAPPAASTAAAAAPDTRSMTPEQRQAFIRAEAQRRIQERLRALGVAAPSAAPANGVDTSVQDRLEAEKLEAARKAAEADEQLKAKELERQAKLERERAKGIAVEQALQDTQRDAHAVQQVRDEVERDARTVPGQSNGAEPRQAVQAAEDQLDAEEKALREREAQLERERDARRKRIEELEREAKEAEENFARSKAAFQQAAAKPKTAPPPPASRKPAPPPSRKAAAPAPPVQAQPDNDDDFAAPAPRSAAVSPPPAPLAPPVPPVAPPAPSAPAALSPAASSIASPPAKSPSTNPFFRLQEGAGGASPATNTVQPGKPNPFFAAAGGDPPAAPPAPPASAAPPAPVAPPAPKARLPPADDDDWDAPAGLEKDVDESDSDDEPIGGARAQRAALAQNLFSGLGMGGRSSPANTTPPTRSAVASPAPAAAGGPPPPPPPPAPAAPGAPPAPKARAVALGSSAGTPDRGALLGAIQGGLKLRKAQTVDKSGPMGAGSVIGDASPPVQTYVPPPREPTPPPAPVAAVAEPESGLEQPQVNGHVDEAPQEEIAQSETLPAIVTEDPLANVDLTRTIRVRSLYDYEAQRDEDLGFAENRVLLAHPTKDGEGDWWYGATELEGSKLGWFPKAYVEEIHAQPARALYAYASASADEHSFDEDTVLAIVDSSDSSWWKAEKDGVIGLVPATYFDLSNSSARQSLALASPLPQRAATSTLTEDFPPETAPEAESSGSDVDGDDDSDDETVIAAREAQRLRVLEAAGLLVKPADSGSPKRRRRPPPARPIRRPGSTAIGVDEQRRAAEEELTKEEVEPQAEEERVEDAYDLYQRAMREQRSASLVPETDSPALAQPSPPVSPILATPPSTATTVKDALQSSVGGFFNRRSRSATVGSEKARPVISSPLAPQGEHAQRDSRASGAFGSTWGSLVDESALAGLPDLERKRQEACYELIVTEQSYVQSLQLVIEVFLTALQPLLPEKALQVIFANIDDILLFDTVFVSQLEERQRQARLYINTIGDVLKEHMRCVASHYRLFCVNQSNAVRTLNDLKLSNAPVRETLERLRVKNLELEHFLLEPMQRVTRYPLLINQILRYTEPDHPDHPALSRALQLAEAALNDINEAVRAHENQEKLAWLSDNMIFQGIPGGHLDLSAPTRLLGARRILREGKVEKAKSRRKLNAYLFNDLLIFTEPRPNAGEVVYRYPIPLEESSVREHSLADSEFSVTHRGEAIRVRADTPRLAQAWARDIEGARRACLQAVNASRTIR